ncbi:MAG: hypothetical protein JZU47_18640 [Prolixibacteraceae bacterium]|nr:hypothetical protein [Prolixibacteraceae bacterium]
MLNLNIIKKQYTYSIYNGNKYSALWKSIIFYSSGYLARTSELFPEKLCILIMLIGLIGISYSLISLANLNINNRYLRVIFIIYSTRQFYILFQAFYDINFTRIITFIISPYLFLPYLVPLVILIPANIFYTKKTFDYFEILGYFIFPLLLFFSSEILFTNSNFSEQVVWTLGTGCGFIILTWAYHTNARKLIGLLIVLLCLFISTVMARRNIMLTFSNFILFSILIIIFNSNHSIRNKISLFALIILSSISIYFLFINYQNDLFSKITDRITEESREFVYLAFFNDMSSSDLIFGKGFDGTYYCPGIDPERDYRYLIENGYLQIILKGGYISLTLFLLIALPGAYLGIVRSNNTIGRAAGVVVFLWLIDMIPWGMPVMNIRYIILWICLGICYSKEIRILSENEIIKSLKFLSK